jgi:DNA-binding NarL/FixJ family response regulator
MKRPRILLADDHKLVAEGIKRILEFDFDVVGMVENGRELVERARQLHPEAIVVDIGMPLLNGIEAARQIRKSAPEIKIIFLSMHDDPDIVKRCFAVGGMAYVLKRSAPSELRFAVQEALSGRQYLTSHVTRQVLEPFLSDSNETKASKQTLTPRQVEVLQLIAEGKSVKEIASILNIATRTAEFHKTSIMRSLGLHTTAELTKYAIAKGIVSAV